MSKLPNGRFHGGPELGRVVAEEARQGWRIVREAIAGGATAHSALAQGAAAIEWGPSTLYRAIEVLKAAEASEPAGLAALDVLASTGQVSTAYRALRDGNRIGVSPEDGRLAAQPPGYQRATLNNAVHTLQGVVHAVRDIRTVHPDVPRDEVMNWYRNLVAVRRELNILIKELERNRK